jgi:thioesterase domain-containing protein
MLDPLVLVQVVYSQCSSLQSRAKELISNKECRQEEVEAEYKKLEDAINNFAIRLDDRREVLVLAIECFKASDNFMSESGTLSGDIPKDKFEGDNIELEERLSRYKARHNIIHKIALTTIKLWDSLKHRLKSSIVLGEASHCPINYVSATRTLERKMKEIENERERISSICLEREKRWELSLERHKLLKDVSEYFIQLGSWLEGIDPKSDLADNITDAQLQFDIFKRQYNQHEETQEKLLQCGTSINDQIDQLDLEMFGSIDDNIDIKKAVNAVVKEMEEKRERLIKEASPYLNTLQEHVEYHLLDQRSHNLNLMLNQISSSLTKLTGIGQTLQEANSLEEFAKTIQDKINVVSNDIEMFTNSVTDCVNRHHYQSVSLTLLNRSLSEKLSLIKKSMSKKQRVIKSSIEFHTNYNKINSTMEYCQTQFSSRESGKSLMEIDSLQESMRDLKQSMMETADMVKNQAIHLLSILNVPEQNDHKTPNCVSDDSVAKSTTTTTANGTTGTTPRMLVIPKKKPQAQDNKSTNVSRDSDQQIINDLIGKIDGRMNKLKRLWDTRHTRLELSKQVIEFEEEVPRVLKWLDEVGVAHLDRCRDYGRSMEEVEQLLKDFDDFEKKTMTPVSDKVVKLKEMMAHFEENCHYDLNRIRSIGSHLEQRWTSFESDVKTYKSNLNLSLTFQDNLFQGTNWCLQSEQFLHSLDEKINQCDTSKEAESLTAELSVYLTVTKEEQTQRVAKIKEIAGFLHSNPLNELAGQLEQTTNMTMKDFETAQHDLEMLYNKLVQIELEKDKERRLLKQRERVIEELINTEEAYVNDLKLVVETYKPRFISNFLPESLKGKETIVFGNIQWIAEFHLEVVWPQMQTIEDLNYESVARLFIDNAETMTDLYVPYCQNKTDSEELLASHRSYLNRVSSLFGSDIPLSSLLIKPIQRITKYPLLLKDCLKYTKQLGQPTELLEMAVKSVEEIPVQTNNAINLSHLKSEEGLKWHKYGDLLYQGPLLVSEPRLLITSEKERQVFAFENTVVFSRRVEDGQAKFHYEYKFRITLSAAVQVIEFIEGEPCKFALFTSDHRMHLKASSVDVKNQWIRFLRTAVMKHVEEEKEKLRSLTVSGARIRSNAVAIDAISKDLNEKHPKMQMMSMAGRSSSPFSNTRVNMPQIRETSTSPTPVTFDKVIIIFNIFIPK